MAPRSKSLFRQPGARHFQLVHRSQRDPLINDPEAGQQVLKPIERENSKKVSLMTFVTFKLLFIFFQGKSRIDLEKILSPDDLAYDTARANAGEATLYGIYYDDTDYDYMQHLRQVGLQDDGVESVLLEAPSKKATGKKSKDAGLLFDLPEEALPSTSELPRDYMLRAEVPIELTGLQPDMDPHLRQTLEALDDDAFVEDDLEDDFFSQLVGGGERDEEEEVLFEFREEGYTSQQEEEDDLQDDDNWEARFARFKKEKKSKTSDVDGDSDLGSDTRSEGADTVGQLPNLSVIGGKRRRKGTSEASGYSMSSSSMFRNEGLTLLDEKFDHVRLGEPLFWIHG